MSEPGRVFIFTKLYFMIKSHRVKSMTAETCVFLAMPQYRVSDVNSYYWY